MELILLILTIPFFYVWGFISFIKFLGRGGKPSENTPNTTDRKSFLISIIAELKKINSEKKATTIIADYEAELRSLVETAPTSPETAKVSLPPEKKTVTSAEIKATALPKAASAPSFQNWYKDNSINLLLYVGAFLIVVSASIYVGLEAVAGTAKGFVLSAVTLLFFFSGLWFHNMPKVRNAGSAFTAIGALLIPITGLGWYNFVFRFTDVPMGAVWLVTSLIGILAYIVLARYFKSAFYSYVSCFSTISFSLSIVNTQGLENDFYILASILSSIVLLGVGIYMHNNKKEASDVFYQPFMLTANVVMPISILYGMFFLSDASVFTLQSTVSVFLGCIFYCISYTFFKKPWYLFALLVFFSLTLFYFASWQHFEAVSLLHLMVASAYLDILVAYYFQKKVKIDEENFATTFSIAKVIFIFWVATTLDFEPYQTIFFALFPVIIGLLVAILKKNFWFTILSSIFLAITLYIGMNDIFQFSDKPYLLGLLYTLVGIGWYFLCVKYKHSQTAVTVFGLSCILYFILSTSFISDNWLYQMTNSLTIAVLSYSAYKLFTRREFLYTGSLAVSFTLWSFSEFMQLRDYPYLLGSLYAISGLLWYFACLKYKHRIEFLNSFAFASVINFAISIIVLFSSQYLGYQLMLTVVLAGVFLSAAIEFAKKEYVYLSNAFLVFSAWNLLRFLHIEMAFYPLAFAALSYIFYFLSTTLSASFQDLYRKSGLVTAVATTLFFGLTSFDSGNYHSLYLQQEGYALLSAYATFILYGFDAYSRHSSRLGYTTSVIGLVTYLWQIHYLGILDSQYYTVPIGFYFFCLSFLQRKKTDQNLKHTFDYLSTFFIIVPSWAMSFGEQGLTHALLLGLCGILLLAFGITYTDKWYRYAGIAALVIAVISQSKWAIIGIAGFGFLATALYLLILRKDSDHSQK